MTPDGQLALLFWLGVLAFFVAGLIAQAVKQNEQDSKPPFDFEAWEEWMLALQEYRRASLEWLACQESGVGVEQAWQRCRAAQNREFLLRSSNRVSR